MDKSIKNYTIINRDKTKRIWELDMLRGFAIIMVFFDHLFFDFAVFFDSWAYAGSEFLNTLHFAGIDYVFGGIRTFWRPAFLFLFLFTSGLCTAFSRDNFLRGVKLLVVAIFVSFITYYISEIFEIDAFILFGILHCLALIILIYALVEFLVKLLTKLVFKLIKIEFNKTIYQYILSIVCIILSAVFLEINMKYNVTIQQATAEFNSVTTNSKILGLFFYVDNWWTGDYFPLFPFISFFFFGAGLTKFIYPKKKTLFPYLDSLWHKPFSIPGKYSILFYLGGQVIAIGFGLICSLINGIPIF